MTGFIPSVYLAKCFQGSLSLWPVKPHSVAEQNVITWLRHILFICSSGDEHLGCFCFLVMMNNAAMKIRGLIFIQTCVFISLGYIPRSGTAGSYSAGNSVFNPLRSTKRFFKAATAYMRAPISPHSLLHTRYCKWSTDLSNPWWWIIYLSFQFSGFTSRI